MSCSMIPVIPQFGLFFLFAILTSSPGYVLSAIVTLSSIQIYKTHDWIGKPTVYFQCKGENKTVLPDVKEADVVYTFKGEESWQPLTDFSIKKCKRCGFYEKDWLPKHDAFDEWELCPSDFTARGGIYTHLKDKELNVTFQCPDCVHLGADPHDAPETDSGLKGTSIAVVIVLSFLVTLVVIIGLIGGYKFWQKRKRQKEQARFLRLFEEHDELEDELGLGEML